MATAAPSLTLSRRVRLPSPVVVAALSALAAGVYAWMRIPVAEQVRQSFTRICSSVDMRPEDWPCRVSSGRTLAAYVGGSLLIGLALALPGVVLAAAGRRVTALMPLALVPLMLLGAEVVSWFALQPKANGLLGIFETPIGGTVGRSFWQGHTVWARGVDLVLVGIPAVAVALLVRPRRHVAVVRPSAKGALLATGTCTAAIAVIVWASARLHVMSPFGADTATPVVVMAAFGAVLGTDRRWWPWSIVPVAFLLSLGPAMALFALPGHFVAMTWFGAVLPYALVGLASSAWQPLAKGFSRREVERTPDTHSPTRALRPAVALNAAAASLLVVAFLAHRYDPLPVQLATSLPIYLGIREQAQDVRAKTSLQLASQALEAYREANGTFRGFDARAGEAAVPTLDWHDGPTNEPLVIGVTEPAADRAQVVTLSANGTAYCVQDTNGATMYGEAQAGVRAARAACAVKPWTAAAIGTVPVAGLCLGVDDQGIVICRAVQRLVRNTLATPTA